MVRVSDAKSDCSRRGEAEVRILNFKTTWSEFHNLSRSGPKQLCASAHLGCTRAADTSEYLLFSYVFLKMTLTKSLRKSQPVNQYYLQTLFI